MFSSSLLMFFQVTREVGILQANVFPVVQGFIGFCAMIVIFLMVLRMVFNYADPNPFGYIGRFSFKIKKLTDKAVYPIARFLAQRQINTKFAPLIALLGFILVGFYVSQLFYYLCFSLDKVIQGTQTASIMLVVGGLLYGFLGVYSMMVFFRILLSWVADHSNKILKVLVPLTDPILEPFRKIIPPLGMFDISPIVVLLILGFLQTAVHGVLLR